MTNRMIAIVLLVMPALAAAQERRGLKDDTFSWSERMPSGSWLRVYDPNGQIEVTQASGDVAEVRAEKRFSGRSHPDVEFEIRRDGSSYTICAVFDDSTCDEDGSRSSGRRRRSWDDDEGHARVHFVVRVPRGVRLRVASGNGDVDVRGASADVEASSGNGRVSVSTSSGSVRASSGNGAVTVEGATDRVQANSGNGRVLVSTSRGPVTASSGNGDIDVRMDSLNDDDDMTFSTGNGRISVTVPSNFSGEVEGILGHGEFRSDFPLTVRGRLTPSHVRATIGDSRRRVRMSTGNGSIELLKRG